MSDDGAIGIAIGAKRALESFAPHVPVITTNGADVSNAIAESGIDGKPVFIGPGTYSLSALTRPLAANVVVRLSPLASFTGGRMDFRNIIPYIPAPVISPDLYSRSYGTEWNGTRNIFQRASFAKSNVVRGGANTGPAVVAVYGMGEAAVPQSAAWGCNFAGYASAAGAVAIANETDSGALVEGGIAYNTVLVATGYFPTECALQIQSAKLGGEFRNGIVFNNRAITSTGGTGDPITTDIASVTGTLFYVDDNGISERLIRSLGTHTISEWETQNMIVGPSYIPAEGSFRRYSRLDVNSGGLYWRARDLGDTPTNLYFGSVSSGSVLFLTGRITSGGEVTQVEVRHTAGATDHVTLTGGAGDVVIGVAGTSTNSSISMSGKGTGGGKMRDGASATKIQWNTTGIGFNASTPIAKPTISGSRGGNAALASLLTALASYGLIIDGTSV